MVRDNEVVEPGIGDVVDEVGISMILLLLMLLLLSVVVGGDWILLFDSGNGKIDDEDGSWLRSGSVSFAEDSGFELIGVIVVVVVVAIGTTSTLANLTKF